MVVAVGAAVLPLLVARVLVLVATAVMVAVVMKVNMYLRTYCVPGTVLALPCWLVYNVSNSIR